MVDGMIIDEMLPTSDAYIVVTADGSFVTSHNAELSKQATKTLSSSFFDCLGPAAARRLTDAVGEAENPYPIGVELHACGQYSYGAVEIKRDFGIPYFVVRLYKSKRDYLYSDYAKRSVIDRMTSDSPDFGKTREQFNLGEYSSVAGAYSDAIAISSLLKTVNKHDFEKIVFDVEEVNGRIVSFFASSEARRYTDCKIVSDGGESDGVGFFASDRDLSDYVELIVSLIASLTLVSTSREIRITTESFDGSARVRIETDTADVRLKTMSSTDVGVFASAVPRSFARIIKAEYIAVSQNIRLLAVGSLSAGTVAFDLTVTNEKPIKIEFKHKNPMALLDGMISSASCVFPMGISGVQAGE